MIIKPIIGYSGYFISESGRVFCNLGRGNRRDKYIKTLGYFYEIKPRATRTGYLRVYMRNDRTGKREDVYIHRLVAQHYIPNPNNYRFVNHLDTDKTNNCVENLEWCTAKQNTEYTLKVGHLIRNEKGQYQSVKK